MKRFFAVFALLFCLNIAHAQTAAELQKQADAAYAEKSYARALDLYRKAKAAGDVRAPEDVDFRILVALGETQKWDEALDSADYVVKNTEWKARVWYFLGRLYTKLPHQGYKVGEKMYRGEDYPKIEGAEKPQQVYLGEEDAKAALDYLEKAKVQAQIEGEKARTNRYFAPIYPLPFDQEIDLNFDLAAMIPQREFQKFIEALDAGKGGDEAIDVKSRYNPEETLPKKVLYLYNEIPFLDKSDSKHDSALALLAKGLFVQAYIQRMNQWANKYDEEAKKYIKRPYPFDHLVALDSWREVVAKYPSDPIADQTQLLIAQNTQGGYAKQLVEYQKLIQLFPKSKLVADAKAAIQNILATSLSFSVQGVPKPGENPKISANARNLKTVQFAAYKIKLEDFITAPDKLKNPEIQFTEFGDNFGAIGEVVKKLGAPVAKWNWETGDNGDYNNRSKEIEVPIKNIGAYLVVASAPQKRYADILVISDLTILKKTDRDNTFVFAADAKTGDPINGANVVVKETYHQNSTRKVSLGQGKTDDSGFFDKKIVSEKDAYSNQISAFAWMGDRYAVTGPGWGSSRYGDNRDEAKVLSYTDRPVYRPAQKVYFRQILTQRIGGGDQKPIVGAKVTVSVRNPKGENIFNKTLVSSEFGTINGDFDLPTETPLGEYNVQATIQKTNQNIAASGASRFRVEEYKRPEFEVTVSAPKEAKRPGETVAARINAKYYFGAPVPNATVKYTVRKSTWWANFRFPQKFDWLYQYWGVGDYDTGRRNIGGEGSGAIVKEGEVKTDAQGNAELSFETSAETEKPQNNWWRYYSNPLYTIEAEVTDASRRTIEAQGQVKVAEQQYFAFLNLENGYFREGDRIPVEVRTQDANEQPVAASGKMVVYRLLPGDKEEKVFEEAIQTDKNGYAIWNYEAKTGGQFRIAFEATDAWNKEVRASQEIYVVGAGLNGREIRLRGVTILLDKKYYEEGDTARAVLVADEPGAQVLFTQEAGGEILKRDVVKITGKSREITIPITKSSVPNFFLAAALVQDYQVFQAQAEVFVPPVRQLLNVSVAGDKKEYKPGETGTFTIKATDYRGQPARGEFSLALIDASLFYIQKDYTPDLRTFYYAQRRANSVNLDSSRSGNFQATAENDDKPTPYETHGWNLPDDLGQLNLPPGGFGYYPGMYSRKRGNFGGMGGGGFADGRIQALESRAMPMDSAAPVAILGDMPMAGSLFKAKNGAKEEAESGSPVEIRSNFAETAFWSPAVVTEGGTAKVEVRFPDSLTQWHATARGLTDSVQVGSGENDVETKKDLLVRLQAPRFFVERDQVTISANVHNYSDKTQDVEVELGTDGLLVETPFWASSSPREEPKKTPRRASLRLAPKEEKRVDWQMEVKSDGKTEIQVTAKTETASDGVKMSFPVLVHGVQRFAAQSGVMKSDGKQTITLNFPKERRFGASQLNAQFNPSLAAQMLDALPYLADYPYGCVEQTMSRFLPSVIAARTLSDAGINLSTLRARAKTYAAEAKTQPLGERVKNTGYTYPTGMPNSRDLDQMASRMWHTNRWNNPVYDEAELQKMVDEGLSRLYAQQRPDGGWGWWPGSSFSDEYMSAYVTYGLATAKAAEVPVRDDVLNRAYSYLEKQIKDEDNIHLLTYIAYALSQRGQFSGDAQKIVAGRLYEQRERLTALSKSYLALALWNGGEKEKAGVLVRNLENTAVVDEANKTARWKMAPQWWYWWNNDVETNALALRAFVTIDPQNKLTDYTMKWLTLQSRGNHWRSTKETAEAVYSLAAYVQKFKELDVDYTLKVSLNGKIARTYRVNRDNALLFDNRFISGDLFLENGANTLTIEKTGKGNLYWNAYSEYFSLEEPIKASGNEIAIKRRYFKLTRATADEKPNPLDLGGIPLTPTTPLFKRRSVMPRPIPVEPAEPEYKRTEIKDNDTLTSGDLVEVELTLDSANDYSYLVFEDMKAAGLEPVDIRSGGNWGDGLSSNVELRDEKVAFFVDRLPQGTRVLRYRMRAEIPGKFHALPTNGYAMYAPEVRAISDEMRIGVKD